MQEQEERAKKQEPSLGMDGRGRTPPDRWDRWAATPGHPGDQLRQKRRRSMNSWSRQRWLVTIIGIIFVLILSACGGSSSSGSSSSGSAPIPLKIMVGGPSKQIHLPKELAKQLGDFGHHGLDVTPIDGASGQSSDNEGVAG